MVPALTKGGPSFKGAALYYLHDKRESGEAERLTAERVAWTHTLNLPTDDPDKAWRMMATTAMKAGELKAAAGVKATGNKLTKPALAYSLSWHPDEKPSQAEQIEAARETLQLLGLSEHQAVIVAHRDEPHAHVHVIVNRVHPVEGRAAKLSNSKSILSKWAQAYEEKRGRVICPKRVENNAKRDQGEYVRDPRVPRPVFEFRRAVSNDNATTAFTRAEQKGKDAALYQAGRDMHERHRKQWDELKRLYQSAKGGLYERAGERQRTRADEIKAGFKPHWADLFRRQRDERRAFDQREGSLIGTLFNMWMAARELRQSDGADLTPLAMTVLVLSRSVREGTLTREQERDRKDLARAVSQAVGEGRDDIRSKAKAEAGRLRTGYLEQCATLRAAQAQERAAIKLAWANRNAERKAAFAPLRDRADKWRRLEELGRLSRQQGQGLATGRYRGREMRRE